MICTSVSVLPVADKSTPLIFFLWLLEIGSYNMKLYFWSLAFLELVNEIPVPHKISTFIFFLNKSILTVFLLLFYRVPIRRQDVGRVRVSPLSRTGRHVARTLSRTARDSAWTLSRRATRGRRISHLGSGSICQPSAGTSKAFCLNRCTVVILYSTGLKLIKLN